MRLNSEVFCDRAVAFARQNPHYKGIIAGVLLLCSIGFSIAEKLQSVKTALNKILAQKYKLQRLWKCGCSLSFTVLQRVKKVPTSLLASTHEFCAGLSVCPARKIMAMMLTTCMLFTMFPGAAFGDEAELVIAFDQLDIDTLNQVVPVGTPLKSLDLPDILEGIGHYASADIIPEEEEAVTPPAVTEPDTDQKPENPPAVTEPDTDQKPENPPAVTEPDTDQKPENPPAVTEPDTDQKPENPPAVTEPDTDQKPENPPAVTEPDTDQKPEKPPAVTDPDTDQKPEKPPAVTDPDTDQKPEKPPAVTESENQSIAPSQDRIVQNKNQSVNSFFAENKDATPEGMRIIIPRIKWRSTPEYDPQTAGEYIFTPILPQGYTLGKDTVLPNISVIVDETLTVTFDSNGGSGTMVLTKVAENTTIKKPTDPTKDESEFLGWYKEENFVTLWDFTKDTVTKNLTLYAKWSKPKPQGVIYLGGIWDICSDDNDGTSKDKAVKTFARAKELVKENGTIQILGLQHLKTDQIWDLEDKAGVTVKGHGDGEVPEVMINVDSCSLTLKNIELDAELENVSTGAKLIAVQNSGTLIMDSGSVIENNVNTGDSQGTVELADNAVMEMKGNATIRNNIGRKSQCYGGGIYASGKNITLTLKDNASVENNVAHDAGGGIYFESAGGVLTMSGNAAVTGNTVTATDGVGGGIHLVKGTMKVADNVDISNNKLAGKANNVSLNAGQVLTVTGKLGDTSSIGVAARVQPTKDTPVIVAEGNSSPGYSLTAEDLGKFVKDSTESKLAMKLEAGKVILYESQGTALTEWITGFIEGTTYTIENAEQLARLAALVAEGNSGKGCTFKLIQDIDLSSVCSVGTNWTPIGGDTVFDGTFDGQHHGVSGLYINNDEGLYTGQGLFGMVGEHGTVKNTGVVSGTVGAESDYVGALAGINDGIIQSCYSTIPVSGNLSSRIGGIVGSNSKTVKSCYTTGAISGAESSMVMVGGIVGVNNGGLVENCYTVGTVSGNGDDENYAGGIAGTNQGGGTIQNCFATGKISGNYAGGILGTTFDANTLQYCVGLNEMISSANDWAHGRVITDNLGVLNHLYGWADMKIGQVGSEKMVADAASSPEESKNGKGLKLSSGGLQDWDTWFSNSSAWNIPAGVALDGGAPLPTLEGVGGTQNPTLHGTAAAPGITVGSKAVYADGNAILIQGVGASNTNIYLDINGNGIIDSGENPVDLGSIEGGSVSSGYDLGQYTVYGGNSENPTAGSKITMLGGSIKNLSGGGNAAVMGDSYIEIKGGTVGLNVDFEGVKGSHTLTLGGTVDIGRDAAIGGIIMNHKTVTSGVDLVGISSALNGVYIGVVVGKNVENGKIIAEGTKGYVPDDFDAAKLTLQEVAKGAIFDSGDKKIKVGESCDCSLTAPTFTGGVLAVPYVGTKTITLSATGSNVTGDCRAHNNKTVSYRYQIKAPGAGASLSGSGNDQLTVTQAGTVEITVMAVANGKLSTSTSATFTVKKDVFVSVSNITGVPLTAVAGSDMVLTGTVAPDTASRKLILWSIKNAGGTGAVIREGRFHATGAGTAIVTATVKDGTASGTDFTKNFTITVRSVSAKVTISGTVIDQSGSPVEGAKVTLTPDAGHPNPAWTGTDGKYEIKEVPNGSYTVTILFPDGSTAIGTITVKPDGTIDGDTEIKKPAASTLTVTEQPKDVSVLQTATVSLLVKGDLPSGGVPAYQWYWMKGSSPQLGSDLKVGTGDSLLIEKEPYTKKDGVYRFYCVVSGETFQPATSRVATVTVEKGYEITITPKDSDGNTLLPGTPVQILPGCWQENPTIPAAPNPPQITVVVPEGTITVVVPQPDGGSVTYPLQIPKDIPSGGGEIVLAPPAEATLSILSQPKDATVLQNEQASFEVKGALPTGGEVNYQWYQASGKSLTGTAILGATASLYHAKTSEAGNSYYYCVISAGNMKPIASRVAQLTVRKLVTVIGTVTDKSGTPVSGAEVVITDTSTGTVYGPVMTGTDGKYIIPSVPDGSYTVTVTYPGGETGTGNITVTPGGQIGGNPNVNLPAVTKITIVTQPKDTIAGSNDSVRLLVEASVSTSDTLIYQWYENTKNEASGGTRISGAVAKSYAPSTKVTGITYYYCTISAGDLTVASRPAKLTVRNTLTGTTVTGTVKDTDDTLVLDATVILTEKENSGNTQTKVTGTDGAYTFIGVTDGTYTVTVIMPDGRVIVSEVTVTDGKVIGVDTTVDGSTEVQPPEIPVITLVGQPSDLSVSKGERASLKVRAAISTAEELQYQWYRNTTATVSGGVEIHGETTPMCQPTTDEVGVSYYYCKVRSANADPITSRAAKLIVNDQAVSAGEITGTVTDDAQQLLVGVTVKVMKDGTNGIQFGSSMVTAANGTFRFENIPYGSYSLVAEKESQIVTKQINIKQKIVQENLMLVAGNKNTKVEVKDGAPSVAADNLIEMFTAIDDQIAAKPSARVEIKLVIEERAKEALPQGEVESVLEQLTKNQSVGVYLDAKLLKTITGAGSNNVSNELIQPPTGQAVKIVLDVPKELQSKAPYSIIRVHDGIAVSIPATYDNELQTLSFEGDLFSTYAIAYTEENKDSDGDDSGSHSGGSHSGGGSSEGYTPPIITKPEAEETDTTTAETTIKTNVDGNGKDIVTISKDAIDAAVQTAEREAKKNNTQENGIAVTVCISTSNKNVSTMKVNLPKATQELLIAHKVKYFTLLFGHTNLSMTFDLEAIEEIHKQADADVQLTLSRGDESSFEVDGKAEIGTRPAYGLTASYQSGTKWITELGDGRMSLQIPYSLAENEQQGDLCLIYAGSGKERPRIGSTDYDAVSKRLKGKTGRLTGFAVGHLSSAAMFDDIAGHWAEWDILATADHGVWVGTGKQKFSPNAPLTRATIVTVLGRMAGIDPNSYPTKTFINVKMGAYYAPYAEWAVQNGLLSNETNHEFAPNQVVNRQEMAVMLQRYKEAAGDQLSQTAQPVSAFSDRAAIYTGAAAAVNELQQAGILIGRNGNRFEPKSMATRAEFASLLQRYMEFSE